MVLYLVYKCTDCDGHLTYNKNSLVGIYDDFQSAKTDLMVKLHTLDEDSYEIEFDGNDENYFFVKILRDKYTDLCYEIIEKKMGCNKLYRVQLS